MLLLVVVAFVAGLVTAVSPCVLPILPVVLATGADGDRRRPYLVIAGLIASFSFFTLASVQIISALHLPSNLLRFVAIGVIAGFGLTLLVPRINLAFERATLRMQAVGGRLIGRASTGPLDIVTDSGGGAGGGMSSTAVGRKRGSIVGGLLTGLGLGLVWTPCAGPILGAITSLAVTAPGSGSTLVLVIAYAIGAGLPLLAIAQGGRRIMLRLRLRSAAGWATRALGALVIATAGLMAVGADTTISAQLTSALPDWTNVLQTLERSNPVRVALDQIEGRDQSATPSSGSSPATAANLPDMGAAPEFKGIDNWLNSGPLTLADLHGKVVLVDFWTYSCINCIRTLPYVEGWYEKYAAEGFVIVGVHTPEFAFEHDTGNVAAAIERFGITYPVAQDNDFQTWRAYENRYWPAHYLIDANGHIRAEHFGEGGYEETEAQIRDLLAESGMSTLPDPPATDGPVPISRGQSPETYLGSARASGYRGSYPGDGSHDLKLPPDLRLDTWALDGKWDVAPQFITTAAAGDKLEFKFQARDVYLVMSAATPTTVRVAVTDAAVPSTEGTEDVSASGELTVSTARLYHLVHLPGQEQATVTITFDAPGVQAYAFTFGS